MICFRLSAILLLLLFSASPAPVVTVWNAGQSASGAVDLPELVRQAVSNFRARRQRAENYTYLKHGRFKRFDGRGKSSRWETSTIETMFLHGVQDGRLIEYNGRPVPVEQQKMQWEKLQEVINQHWETTNTSLPERAEFYYERELHLPLEQLPEFFNLVRTDEKVVDGRANHCMKAVPKRGYNASNDDERNAQNFELKICIDEKDKEINKVEAKLIGDAKLFNPVLVKMVSGSNTQKSVGDPNQIYLAGTSVIIEWTKINDEAWLPKYAYLKGRFKLLPGSKAFPEEGEATYSDYKKFRVDTQIVPIP